MERHEIKYHRVEFGINGVELFLTNSTLNLANPKQVSNNEHPLKSPHVRGKHLDSNNFKMVLG